MTSKTETPEEGGRVTAIMLHDDGQVPNNPTLPLVICRGVLDAGDSADPEAAFEELFHRNGWGHGWRNGIFDYHHFHSTAHEVLGIARGHAEVRFGGPDGPVLSVGAGDVVAIPAGVGHCRVSGGTGLSVIGAYPRHQHWDLWQMGEGSLDLARENIASVPLPETDPVSGASGPVTELWSKAAGKR